MAHDVTVQGAHAGRYPGHVPSGGTTSHPLAPEWGPSGRHSWPGIVVEIEHRLTPTPTPRGLPNGSFVRVEDQRAWSSAVALAPSAPGCSPPSSAASLRRRPAERRCHRVEHAPRTNDSVMETQRKPRDGSTVGSRTDVIRRGRNDGSAAQHVGRLTRFRQGAPIRPVFLLGFRLGHRAQGSLEPGCLKFRAHTASEVHNDLFAGLRSICANSYVIRTF